jgi:serine/threonine protein kinase
MNVGKGAYAKVSKFANESGVVMARKTVIDNVESAIREICILRACSHSNIVRITEVIYSTPIHLIMDLYAMDLQKYLNTVKFLESKTICSIAHDIVAGVAYLHSKNIIHCDIKPANILLEDRGGAAPKAVICDCGLSLVALDRRRSTRIQTCTHRAPEVDYRARIGVYTEKVDMWSVGCILYELVTNMQVASGEENDSSVCAFEFFGLEKVAGRTARLNILNRLQEDFIVSTISNYVATVVPESLQRDLDGVNFISIIANCLHPDPQKRIDARTLLKGIIKSPSRQNSRETVPDHEHALVPVPIVVPNVDMDEMLIVKNLSAEIISKVSIECLSLAEHIFTKLLARIPETHEVTISTQLAAIYIACCILFRAIPSVDEKIIENVIFIMIKLDGHMF